ncbi:amino acid ABC transporter substrate-binding protein [Pedobacter sp. MR2016-24]|uniref:amino acid ABC transporter substrate-binding protein n=1 Tax=Pedobacter sp. MR2016-24 TaxID=2994466 RepID=UPI00224834DB|nr:amino acid ABC transporter substrate-binding protein [Pedobacter sp. MR2016-24]MCX2482654.1 amino acid ABC transporter substrate-binding protein [Pedobacter sp. MR2016-24]
MILVQNHPLQLSGNRILSFLLICFCLGACSPRTKTVKQPQKDVVKKDDPAGKNTTRKLTEANISLLLPFNVNQQKVHTGKKAEIEKSAMAIDFYQGFKMGLDSAAASTGLDFRLKVLDTKDNAVQISNLIKGGQLNGSDLIVGPVFPDGIKFITNYSIANHLPVISPLAASHPDEFNNPNLISVVNNIELHAQKIGDYIRRAYNSQNTIVVLINPKKSTDEVMAVPLRKYFQEGKGIAYKFQEYSSVYTMETKLLADKQYVVLMSTADRQFVVATLDKLAKMKTKGLQVSLFGHPNWIKQNYNTDKLQLLNTRITSSYYINYKSSEVIRFVKAYRKLNSFEPGEYAFKGFDIGLYFGTVFSRYGYNYLKYLPAEKYTGFHNSFSFIKEERLGYINTSLTLLEYKNYALKPIE